MSANEETDADFKPTTTPGYNPGGSKSPEELAKLDAEDESLARWKASLGIVPGAGSSESGPKLTLLTLELVSSTLPRGKRISFDLADLRQIETGTKKNPVIIKEGVEYNVRITFKVNRSIISGLRYIQVVRSLGVKAERSEKMIGSYGPHPRGEPHVKTFEAEESPSGIIARKVTYTVQSRIVDDDNEVYADWNWTFKLAKEWE